MLFDGICPYARAVNKVKTFSENIIITFTWFKYIHGLYNMDIFSF